MRSLGLALAGVMIGALLHTAWSLRSSTTAAEQREHEWQRVRLEIHQAVRDELNQRAARAPSVVAAPTNPVPETEENKQASAAEALLVGTALKAGRWTEDDVMKLRGILPSMSGSARPKALAGIAKLINEGRLEVEATVPF